MTRGVAMRGVHREWRSARGERLVRRSGQSTVEYAVITVGFLGFTTLGWPFLLRLLDALGRYFHSLYYIIQSPIP